MDSKEMIEDLKTLKDFSAESSGWSFPKCLDYAIEKLSEMEECEREDEDDGK